MHILLTKVLVLALELLDVFLELSVARFERSEVVHEALDVGPRLVLESRDSELLLKHLGLAFVEVRFALKVVGLQLQHVVLELELA